jgi:CBS domain-containing protein
MHDHNVSRLPVTGEGGALVGIISRGDIVKAIVVGTGEDAAPAAGA